MANPAPKSTSEPTTAKTAVPNNRVVRKADFHLGFAGLAVALLLGAVFAAAEDRGGLQVWLSSALFFILVIIVFAWAFMSGWRFRNLAYRLPLPKPPTVRTQVEEARRDATRRIKSELTRLLHAKARPAAELLLAILGAQIAELKSRQEPYFTCGLLIETYLVPEFQADDEKLRRTLEGTFWKEFEKGELLTLGTFLIERDLDKQKPDDLGFGFFFYYTGYRLLMAYARRLAVILDTDIEKDSRFHDWRNLDNEVTTRLREVLAIPELAGFRSDFEELIAKGS